MEFRDKPKDDDGGQYRMKRLFDIFLGISAMLALSVPGCRDAFEPGVSGLLVPVRDAESLALAIEELLTNPKQCTAMGLAGRKLAETEFDVLTVVDKHLVIYLRLLASQ